MNIKICGTKRWTQWTLICAKRSYVTVSNLRPMALESSPLSMDFIRLTLQFYALPHKIINKTRFTGGLCQRRGERKGELGVFRYKTMCITLNCTLDETVRMRVDTGGKLFYITANKRRCPEGCCLELSPAVLLSWWESITGICCVKKQPIIGIGSNCYVAGESLRRGCLFQ